MSADAGLMEGWLEDAPANPLGTLLLAHGAGAPMDSDFMTSMAGLLSARGIRVIRFEFPYMRQRRQDGRKRPPDRQPVLLADLARQARLLEGPLLIGGKSMGGRMASLLAAGASGEEAEAEVIVPNLAGVVCLGYPFHPPGKPERLRTDHFADIPVPTLICQGERDPFGRIDEVSGYGLPATVQMQWIPDGDHDLKPRKSSGRTHAMNLDLCADQVLDFARRC